MALEDDIRTLGETPLLDTLGRDALRLIAFSADRVRLRKGDVLFREGDRAGSSYVVVSGALELTRGQKSRRIGPASLVGEIALIADTVRPATATASEPTELLRIVRSLFSRLFDEYPDIAVKLHARIAERLAADVQDLKSIEAVLRR